MYNFACYMLRVVVGVVVGDDIFKECLTFKVIKIILFFSLNVFLVL